MTSLSHLLFFMADGRLAAERGLTRAYSFSFILSESSRLGIGSRKKTHHHLPYESYSGSLCTITDARTHAHVRTHAHAHTHTHTHTHTHKQITYIQTQQALTHSHICINNIHAEIELLSLHIDDSTGMEGTNRYSLPIKCQTQVYSRSKLTGAAMALSVNLFLRVSFQLVTLIQTCNFNLLIRFFCSQLIRLYNCMISWKSCSD